jgi:iron transport multicopper oxidase
MEDHNMTIVAMDGVYTTRTTARTINVGTGQRFDVLVTTKNDTSKNFGISALIDMSAFNPVTLSIYTGPEIAYATLDYSGMEAMPRSIEELFPLLPPIDDITIAPLDEQTLLGPVDQYIELTVSRSLNYPIPR